MSKLFEPLCIGDLTLAHRVIMAPMTRFRVADDGIVTDITAEYYSQRTNLPGSLVISESSLIAAEAGGYPNFPGIFNDAQVIGWKKVVDAVRSNGSYIFLQIAAFGRVGHPDVLRAGGHPYVSSSAIPLSSRDQVPLELSQNGIKRYIGLYAEAARRAVHEAGSDGVEIHACNGSLIDQFIQDVVNKRTDEYGGSIQNRSKFVLEVVDAVVEKIGAKRTGIRFSPWSTTQGMGMKNPIPTYSYIISELARRHPELGFIHMMDPGADWYGAENIPILDEGITASNAFAHQLWAPRTYITGGGYDHESARKTADALENSAVAFGRLFISNPDLPARIKSGLKLAVGDPSTYCTPGPNSVKGYIDYPFAGLEA